MCSIFGWIPSVCWRSSDRVHRSMQHVAEVLRHRGPDDRGWILWDRSYNPREHSDVSPFEARIAIGMNRLSIIDLSEHAHQPMHSADGRYTIIFNGEIYNHVELRAALEHKGYRFQSRSDTEVLLYSYVAWGEECLKRFVGMFAFAILDTRMRKLFCARDFFGIKPFFYQVGSNGVTFASELPALLEFAGTPRLLNHQKAYDYLQFAGLDVGEDTMVQGVRHLPPGHLLTIDIESQKIETMKRYWMVDLGAKSAMTFPQAAEELRELFLESIRLHLRSDVPIGIALSGGIDSSSLACAVRRVEPSMTINTFSYVARESGELSEERWIDQVNAHIGGVAHKVHVRHEDLVDDLDTLIRRLGEPFGSTSIYAQFRVFKLARESGVKVVLDGQGADELAAGYAGYPGDRMASLIRHGSFLRALQFMSNSAQWPGRSLKSILYQTIDTLVPRGLESCARWVVGKPLAPPWLNNGYLRDHGVRFETTRDAAIYRSNDRLRVALAYASTQQGLVGLLRHGDRNSMTWSLESRVPFCTPALAGFLLNLPEEYLVDMNGRTKALLREAMRGIVPDAILDRRDKIGFATPEKGWLSGMVPWVDGILNEARHSKIVRHNIVSRQWKDIVAGRRSFSQHVWRWLNYLRWRELFSIQE
jgi:asparagine synthase (glutamine-hydrolysing)